MCVCVLFMSVKNYYYHYFFYFFHLSFKFGYFIASFYTLCGVQNWRKWLSVEFAIEVLVEILVHLFQNKITDFNYCYYLIHINFLLFHKPFTIH